MLPIVVIVRLCCFLSGVGGGGLGSVGLDCTLVLVLLIATVDDGLWLCDD